MDARVSPRRNHKFQGGRSYSLDRKTHGTSLVAELPYGNAAEATDEQTNKQTD